MHDLDYVVLVDRKNRVLGTAPKLQIHNNKTPLHRAFSLFLFNKKGEILLQKRSKKKKAWPGVWSNSCCGHPKLKESAINAARRRLKDELGINNVQIYNIVPDFSYKAEKDGIVENELCPILAGFTEDNPKINKDEVENIEWVDWKNFIDEIEKNPKRYSPWCVLEVEILKNNEELLSRYKRFTS